ncbi:hypothetical protein Lfu02_04640 [Longispora fulva]|uniref:Uncharacterized protein n=1 Tax=Longispora fulva TaxID=619741 RepID=A0A8J7GBW6_9ACTN|nr:hypothetical protein [Longispora fulva]MBG6135669.1 hypothetical protein [Longispora fulva]GIG56092.1 hypothetical protein Lfu02_04640 [Longispora fulva]
MRTVPAVAALAVVLLGGSPAAAAPSDYVVVPERTAVTSDGDTQVVSVTIENLTDQELPVVPEKADKCTLPAATYTVPPRTERTLKIRMDGKDCKLAGVELSLQIGGHKTTVTVPQPGTVASTAKPPWELLNNFWIGLGVGAAGVLLGYVFWHGNPLRPMPGLANAKWDFKESWATNTTVITALFTGIFGTTGVLEAILGAKPPSTFSVIIVASAIAVGAVGAAPILLNTLRRRVPPTPGKTGDAPLQPTAIGLMLSAFVTISATAGQLAVLVFAARTLELGGPVKNWILGLGFAGWALLVGYTGVTLVNNLTAGASPAILPAGHARELQAKVAKEEDPARVVQDISEAVLRAREPRSVIL